MESLSCQFSHIGMRKNKERLINRQSKGSNIQIEGEVREIFVEELGSGLSKGI